MAFRGRVFTLETLPQEVTPLNMPPAVDDKNITV